MSPVPQLAQVAIDHARRGNFGQALEMAKRALSLHPRDHGLMLFVGMLQTRRLELEQAASTFREALRLRPTDQLTRLELARVLIAVNQLDEAQKLLSSKRLPGLEPKRLFGLIAIRRGEAEKAVRVYREIVAEDPRDFESRGNLGVALLAAGDASGAVEALRSSLRLRRDQQRFRDKWAEAHIAAGTGEQGIKLAADFVGTHPDDVLARCPIARLHDLLGRPECALETLEEALRIDPQHAPALLALAQLHERQIGSTNSRRLLCVWKRWIPHPPSSRCSKLVLLFGTASSTWRSRSRRRSRPRSTPATARTSSGRSTIAWADRPKPSRPSAK